MRTRLLAGAAALVLAVGGLLVPASPASADCSHDLHRDEYEKQMIFWKEGGTTIRNGPHNVCSSIGVGRRGHLIDVHCAIMYATGETWIYARDLQTRTQGWSRRSTLWIPRSHGVAACQSTGEVFVRHT